MMSRKYLITFLLTFSVFLLYSQYTVEKLDSLVNHPDTDEISPVLGRDGRILYFTRSKDPLFNKTLIVDNIDISSKASFADYDRELRRIYSFFQASPVTDIVNSNYNQDIWIARGHFAGRFTTVTHPEYPLNNALPNSVCDVNQRTNDLYIINQFEENGDIRNGFSISYYENGEYSFPHKIRFEGDFPLYGDINLGISENGDALLISTRKGNDSDIYISHKINYLNWSRPVKLSPDVNTSWRESSPHLTNKDRVLFYSSDYNSKSSDILFNVRLTESWDNWSEKFVLPYPINTRANEGGPYYYGGYLYFSSDRDGSWDIYRAKFKPIEYAKQVMKGYKAPVVVEKVEEKEIPLDIHIYDIYSGEPLKGKVKIVNPHFTEELDYDIHFQGKTVRIAAKNLLDSEILVSARKHLSEGYILEEVPENNTLNYYLYPDSVGIDLAIEPIYFKRSQSKVLPSSFKQLDRIAHILVTHPEIKVAVRGHTDNVGSKEAKIKLSTERAAGVAQYLTRAGVSSERITFEGVGDAEPISRNSNEKTKSQNRRVEIIVTEE